MENEEDFDDINLDNEEEVPQDHECPYCSVGCHRCLMTEW